MVDWRRTGIIKRHDNAHGGIYRWWFDLPRPLADWDVFASWERERFEDMEDHLLPGDVLFDVGAEHGWCSLVYADMVGPENMVLIEPTRQFWPNIKYTWERNYFARPMFCYDGLVSDSTNDERQHFRNWPDCSDGPLIDKNKYEYLHANDGGIPQITIDDLVARTGAVPTAITMDIEGAELIALRGATQTLIDHTPLLWVSVHPDMSKRDYNLTDTQLHTFLESLGYQSEHLATDHEEHWRFW